MEWINIEEKMPKIEKGISERVLVLLFDDERIFEANFFEDFAGKSGWRDYQNTSELESVIYWMPKPKQPERLSPEDVRDNVCDSLNSANK
jgi:hypothetical protein